MKTYAGIGSRKTPTPILSLMNNLATNLHHHGYQLQTGLAVGADTAFRICAPTATVFDINQNELNEHKTIRPNQTFVHAPSLDNWDQAVEIAQQYHPRWLRLGHKARTLITRNTYQVLGLTLDVPVEMVICWTPDGSKGSTSSKTGGTGQAIRIAYDNNIPIYNLASNDDINALTIMYPCDGSITW